MDEVKYLRCMVERFHAHRDLTVPGGWIGPFKGPHFWPIAVDAEGRPVDDAADGSRDGGQPE